MFNEDGITVVLPHGYWENGSFQREAKLRPICGKDELLLLASGNYLSGVEKTSAILTRCITELGSQKHKATIDSVRNLVVGDREALLLQLRRITLGEQIRGVVRCPLAECKEPMDLDLKIGVFLLPVYECSSEGYMMEMDTENEHYKVRFRLPTGLDQEKSIIESKQTPKEVADNLLLNCILEVTTENGDKLLTSLPSSLLEKLSSRMAELDPQAELMLNLTCVKCGQAFSTLFDTAHYFFQELEEISRGLYREVHLLAFYHHWSESEILAMTPIRRRQYLEALVETLESGRS